MTLSSGHCITTNLFQLSNIGYLCQAHNAPSQLGNTMVKLSTSGPHIMCSVIVDLKVRVQVKLRQNLTMCRV